MIPLRFQKVRMDSITTVVQITVEVLASEIKQDKDLKKHGLERKKQSCLCRWHVCLCRKYQRCKKNKAKLLEQIKKREVERCKINTVK